MKFLFICFLSLFFISIEAQTIKKTEKKSLCDTSTDEVCTYSEVMPKYNLEDREIENKINALLNLTLTQKKVESQFYITLRIDCQGRAYDYIVLKTDDTSISNTILQVLKNELTWTNGATRKYKGEPRIFQYNFHFEIKKGEIRLVSTKKKN